MRSRTVLIGAVVVLVVLGAGVFWFLGRESPDAVDIDRAVDDLAQSGRAAEEDASAEDELEDAVLDPTGTWIVDPDVVPFDRETGTGSWVGYRIDEELSGIGAVIAVGRSPRVEGEIVIDGSRVTAADVRADLVGLVSEYPNRDARVAPLFRDRPVTFSLTEPFDFGTVPEDEDVVAVSTRGVLRIGEIEQELAFELSGAVVGQRIVVTGSTIVTLADFDVRVPSANIVLSVSDEATIEFQLNLSRG